MDLREASRLFTELLEFINEYKRSKDLVSKYLNPTGDSIAELMKKININSLKKKSTRISLQISNALGLFVPQVIDLQFQGAELTFRQTEKMVRNAYADFNSYLTGLRVSKL